MNCQDYENLLSAYLDRELNPEDQKEVAGHVETCAHCREELNKLLQVKEHLRDHSLPSIPADLVAEIEAQTLYQTRWIRRQWWVPALAMATAAAVWVLFEFHKPSLPGIPLNMPLVQAPQETTILPNAVLAWHQTADTETSKDLQ